MINAEALQKANRLQVISRYGVGVDNVDRSRPNGNSYHLELSDAPRQANALTVFQAVETLLVTHPYIKQLRLTNPT
jgi:phosphoglycerate dehydrogenase-like enzyme